MAERGVEAFDVRRRLSVKARAADDGTFTLRSLPAGEVTITARRTLGEFAEGVQVNVEEGQPPPKVTLVVREMLELSGEIFSAEGPRAHATVVVYPSMPPGTGGSMSNIRHETGTAGEFKFSSPKQATGLNVRVMAPGFAARMFSAPVPDDGVLMIGVEPEGGTLELRYPERNPDYPMGFLGPRLVANGTKTELFSFDRWIEMHGGRKEPTSREIPAMEPGVYQLCRPMPDRQPDVCVDGFLPALGRLTLDLSAVTGR